ncbi:hypothetical protein K504DRAFT_373862 [Pleomassaria siparia CBS 279.74]|uniref:NYN domain-containing protein n=1 Tax=Pleomassaria siparia CBS 279.74 TaxID=1314801 RepID=A0A6G1KGY7_9PLEO|nr:hypothetical protein K504DRAFT_373862 [Pleomassaria siparia CBS 279.74]
MPFQLLDDTGWDFSSALYAIIDSHSQDIDSSIPPRTKTAAPLSNDSKLRYAGSSNLGNFSRLWEELDLADDVPLPELTSSEPDSEEQTDSDNAFLSATELDYVVVVAEEESLDDVAFDPLFAGLNKKQRYKARKRAEKERRENAILAQKDEQSKKDREARLAASLKNDPNHTSTPVNREQSRSNVGAKMRPITSPLKKSKAEKKGKKAIKEPSVQPFTYDDFEIPTSNPRPTPSPTDTTTIGPACTPLPKPPLEALNPSSSPAKTKVQYNTVGIPIQHQSQYSFPQLDGHGYTQPLVSTPTSVGLVPRTVTPVMYVQVASQMVPQMVPFPTTPRPTAGQQMAPPITPSRQPKVLNVRPRVERHIQLLQQLMSEFPQDVPSLISPMQLINEKTSTEGIHVFVDASNILIGFKDALRRYNVRGYEMSFDSLVLLMERRRPVAKRVYAGSRREAAPLPHVTRLVEISKAIGYENHVNEQVLVTREDSDKKRFFRAVKKMGWIKAAQLHSGSGDSDPETDPIPTTPSQPRWVEQGVDEILHLKMCQSIIDTEIPSTMVLATGDGAEAEHSDGFLAQVERALKKGWKVELVSWKLQTNGGYKNNKFRTKWGDQFKIFHLDGFIDSLIDTE